ncbi:Uu.00g017740.m01.CDS01 [Anthostomella pinea]|uniref:Uu.00g017740.m01.CDS01 n=1 Tax=Anthostomella pinea TaxID=933095 RepID=A0AAI8YQM4_9PEZI|nr:Uu.00g017740.m01.CDS01 [Anthostomella pinea]
MVNAVGTFFIVLVVLLIAAAVGWVTFTQLRARRLGLPAPPLSSYNPFARSGPSPYGPPQPASGGIGSWFSDKLRSLRSSGGGGRSAAGAYEAPSSSNVRGGRRGFGALDPDEAWDTRVGNEADTYGPGGYYEEQELGLHPRSQGYGHDQNQGHDAHEAYSGSGYEMNVPREEERGRTMSRSPGVGGGLGVPGAAGGRGGSRNPFDDDSAEPSNISLRGVSPRPIDTGVGRHTGGGGGAVVGDSPTSTSERRSIFRENV